MLELHEKYAKKVKIADRKIADRKEVGDTTEEDEDTFYLERCEELLSPSIQWRVQEGGGRRGRARGYFIIFNSISID